MLKETLRYSFVCDKDECLITGYSCMRNAYSIEDNRLNCDLGIGQAVKLPEAEIQELWQLTTPQWPMMHLLLRGITRDQMMARHKSNHIQVVYAPSLEDARRGLFAKAAALRELGLNVFLCGEI